MEIQSIYMLGMIGATGACVVGIFYICAACIRDETALHDTKVKARKMRMEFDRRVSARNTGTRADSVNENDTSDIEEPILIV